MFLLPHDVIFTQDICNIKELISQKPTIFLKGSKGCGKSFLTAILFIMLTKNKELSCLYVGPATLTYKLSTTLKPFLLNIWISLIQV